MTGDDVAAREALALAYEDPWGDDAHTLRDKFVTVRVSGKCAWCTGPVEKGQRARAMTQRSDEGEVMTFRFCPACCIAMANITEADRTIGPDGDDESFFVAIDAFTDRLPDARTQAQEVPDARD